MEGVGKDMDALAAPQSGSDGGVINTAEVRWWHQVEENAGYAYIGIVYNYIYVWASVHTSKESLDKNLIKNTKNCGFCFKKYLLCVWK